MPRNIQEERKLLLSDSLLTAAKQITLSANCGFQYLCREQLRTYVRRR